jgi:pyridoxamine 5'-phosphate oxidase
MPPDPLAQLRAWLDDAAAAGIEEPSAAALATADAAGRPSLRFVLVRGIDERGARFFTNYDSRKARELDETGSASLLFTWRSVERQVRIDGSVEKVSAAESDAYFATRPIESRWGTYASQQSEVIASRDLLEQRFHAARERYGNIVPRPPWWGGYRVIPDEFEFWQGRPSRLHDRLRYRQGPAGEWRRDRLAP